MEMKFRAAHLQETLTGACAEPDALDSILRLPRGHCDLAELLFSHR